MLNKIIIMGRLTRDPELRRTSSGTAVAALTLAVDRDYSQQGGEKETDFIDVVAWRNTAEFVSKYFSKGRMAVVAGRLQIRPWTDKDGNKRRTAEVVADNVYFGDSRHDAQPGGSSQSYGGQPSYNQPTSYNQQPAYGGQSYGGGYQQTSMMSGYPEISDDDSELPF